MDNAEEVLHFLEEFSKHKPKTIPPELDEYLAYVARTGDPVYQWPAVKCLFKEKLINVIADFNETSPGLDIPPYPNVDPFNYETMKESLMERLDSFIAAPFTVQRICELLMYPRKQYNRIDKFMRAIEKNILVVSTREPGVQRHAEMENGEAHEPMVNGSDTSDYTVDVEMEDVSLKKKSEQNHVQEPQPSSSDNPDESVKARLQPKQDSPENSPKQSDAKTEYESITPPESESSVSEEPQAKISKKETENEPGDQKEEEKELEVKKTDEKDVKMETETVEDSTSSPPAPAAPAPAEAITDADQDNVDMMEDDKKPAESSIAEPDSDPDSNPEPEKVTEVEKVNQKISVIKETEDFQEVDLSGKDSPVQKDKDEAGEAKVHCEIEELSESSSENSSSSESNTNSPKNEPESVLDLIEESNSSVEKVEENGKDVEKISEEETKAEVHIDASESLVEPNPSPAPESLQNDNYSISDVKSELVSPTEEVKKSSPKPEADQPEALNLETKEPPQEPQEPEVQKEVQKEVQLEVQKEVQMEVQKEVQMEVQKEVQMEVQKEVQMEVQKEVQKEENSTNKNQGDLN